MRINVARLRHIEGSSQDFSFSEVFPSLEIGGEEYVFEEPVNVNLNVINTGKSLLVRGNISSVLKVNCSRCLKEMAYKLNLKFDDEWIPSEYAKQGDEDNALIFDNDEFSIDSRIIEHILVSLPMRFVCSEECKGLCPVCGVDKNENNCTCSDEVIDPRLEILSKWNKGV
ncbi:MAG: DUF177 domain-containing protein [Peptococcaceae bacterium]|nr:DUF177 domain-containing protein [Peptococcaceae bacterium]